MSLPYRPPAKRPADGTYAWNAPLVTAGCSQHHRTKEMVVQKFTNTTEVKHDSASAYDEAGTNGAPFNRRNWYDAIVGGGSTADTGAWALPSVCSPDHAAGASSIFDDGTGGTMLSTTDYPNIRNFYAQDGSVKLNFSKCRDRGWKALRAQRMWHGEYGFRSRFDSPLPGVKYLKAHIRASINGGYVIDPSEGDYDCSDLTKSRTITVSAERIIELEVDPLSGKMTANVNTFDYTGSDELFSEEVMLDLVGAFIDEALGMVGTADFETNCADYLAAEGQPGTESFSCTDTELAYAEDTVKATSYFTAGTRSIEITLSVENSLASVQSDLEEIAKTWDLSSRVKYQWRTDGYCGFQPLVSRDEYNIVQSPLVTGILFHYFPLTQYNQTPLAGGETEADHQSPWTYQGYCWTGSASIPAATPTGNIIGRPLPDGYTRAFNFAINTYDHAGPTAHGCYGNIVGYGMQSPYVLPQSATLWLENFENWSENQATCEYAPYAKQQGWTITTVNGITAQIYCEVKEDWASQNYFRPAGEDRAKTDADGVALWPKAWGILGRVAVTVEDLGGGQIKFNLPAATTSANGHWPSRDLRVGDTVRIFPSTIALSATAPHNTGALGDVVIDSLDETSITVTAAFATYATAKWAMGGHATRSHDELPAYPLDDPAPKGQFVFISQTISDAATSAVTKSQLCLPTFPCTPNVLSIGYANQAVEGKGFQAGHHVAFPAVVPPATTADTQIWRGAFIQRMPDLFYVDKVDCTGDCSRDGCDEDFCDKDIDANRPENYPFQIVGGFTRRWDSTPWVEAMIALPTWLGGVTLTATDLPTTAAGEIGAGNPKAPAVVFSSYSLPEACYTGAQMRRYTTTIAEVSSHYLDAPWTDTSLPYAQWP